MVIELSSLFTRLGTMSASNYNSIVSMNLFVALLLACIVIGHLLEENKWGLSIGFVTLLVSGGRSSHLLVFSEDLFFIYLLPPIIFNASHRCNIRCNRFCLYITADLLFSSSASATRFVIHAAFDNQRRGKQLATLHAVGNIIGETRPESSKMLSPDHEENLRRFIYETASNSTKLTPSGYRLVTGLASRPWFLMEICSRQEIINIVTDPYIESTKISMEARHKCCQAIYDALAVSTRLGTDPALARIAEKEALKRGPYVPGTKACTKGELTVRETLSYSARFQGVGDHYDMLAELSRREKEANIKPGPDIDLFMKVYSKDYNVRLIISNKDSTLIMHLLRLKSDQPCSSVDVFNMVYLFLFK